MMPAMFPMFIMT